MNVNKVVNDAIQISRLTYETEPVPILFLSNPGVGKTTIIKNYARSYNYEYEELIGSRSTPEEILGYQVNEPGHDTLILKFPTWFIRIIENGKLGKKSILFIDEITTTSPYVQAALLKLIFDREIDKLRLPDDCLIIAAGNYSGNLGGVFDMLTPTLNRFMIVNLNETISGSSSTYSKHFVNSYCNFNPVKCTPVKYIMSKLTGDQLDELESDIKDFYNKLFTRYSSAKKAEGLIDLRNTEISGSYQSEGLVYGVISPRVMYYSMLVIRAGIESNITDIGVYVNGLIGNGSNQFDKAQGEAYRDWVAVRIEEIRAKYAGLNVSSDELNKLGDSIDKVTELDAVPGLVHEIIDYKVNQGIDIPPTYMDKLFTRVQDIWINQDRFARVITNSSTGPTFTDEYSITLANMDIDCWNSLHLLSDILDKSNESNLKTLFDKVGTLIKCEKSLLDKLNESN